jgi:hypothetical protein
LTDDMKNHLRAMVARLTPPTITMEPKNGRLHHVQPVKLGLSTADALKVAIQVLDAAAGKCPIFSAEWELCSGAVQTLMAIEAQTGCKQAFEHPEMWDDDLPSVIDTIVFG